MFYADPCPLPASALYWLLPHIKVCRRIVVYSQSLCPQLFIKMRLQYTQTSLPQWYSLNQFGFLYFFFVRSIVFWLQKKYMPIVECNWFSRALILSLHSLWVPIWAIWEMLEGQLSLNANASCAAFAGERASGETSIHSWVLPGQPFSLCKHPSPIVVFCPSLSNKLSATTAGIKRHWLTRK